MAKIITTIAPGMTIHSRGSGGVPVGSVTGRGAKGVGFGVILGVGVGDGVGVRVGVGFGAGVFGGFKFCFQCFLTGF
ncbi:MAG: hypothetical protein ABC536_07110 [Candidatus Methanosuratincola petrocarbonis]